VAWITVSAGGISPRQAIPVAPGYQIPLAQAGKDATGLSTTGVGLITEPQQAEDVVASGRVDVVALARAMLYNPRWGWHAAAALAPPSMRRHRTGAPPQYQAGSLAARRAPNAPICPHRFHC